MYKESECTYFTGYYVYVLNYIYIVSKKISVILFLRKKLFKK